MARNAPNPPDWHSELTRRLRRKRLKEVLSVAAVLLVILAVAAAFNVDPRRTVAEHRGTLAETHLVDRAYGPPVIKVSVRLDSGAIVPLRGVPDFRQGARVFVREEVSRVFRLHRFTFVSFEDSPSP